MVLSSAIAPSLLTLPLTPPLLATAEAELAPTVLAGVLLSLVWDSAPAPTLVMLLTAGFLLALAWRLWRDRRRSGDKGVQVA